MKSKKLIILSLIISIFTIKINDSNALLGFGAYTGLKHMDNLRCLQIKTKGECL